MRTFLPFIAALFLLPAIGFAQSATPYAGMQVRPIKALSDQQLADLKAGRGMGLALPAELNGYPGPAHVLELAQVLNLNDEQKSKVSKLFEAMHAESVVLGERLIAAESDLDRLFANKTVTDSNLSDATHKAAELQGELRVAHLKYHLATLAILTQEQVVRYREARGYGASTGVHGAHQH